MAGHNAVQCERSGLPESVSRETREALEVFHAELRKWSARINLVSPLDLNDLWGRHIVDCAQIFSLGGDRIRIWCDLGTGGGLPGLVVAILARDTYPDRQHILVEADRRKAAFLQVVSAQLKLRATIVAERAETAPPANADVVTARALAPLPRLLPLVCRHLSSDGCAILPKGARHVDELQQARQGWHFDLTTAPSQTSDSAVILMLRRIQPAARDL